MQSSAHHRCRPRGSTCAIRTGSELSVQSGHCDGPTITQVERRQQAQRARTSRTRTSRRVRLAGRTGHSLNRTSSRSSGVGRHGDGV